MNNTTKQRETKKTWGGCQHKQLELVTPEGTIPEEESGASTGAPDGFGASVAPRSVPESSPTYSSASHGFIERGIQSVEGQARAVKSAMETHIGVKVSSDHNVVPWIIEYASVLLNRGQVGED